MGVASVLSNPTQANPAADQQAQNGLKTSVPPHTLIPRHNHRLRIWPTVRSGRGTTMIGTVSTGRCPMPPARDRSGTRGMTWALATVLLARLRRASPAVAMVIVLETLSALAAEPVQISNKESFHIFSDSKYAKRLNSAVSNDYLF